MIIYFEYVSYFVYCNFALKQLLHIAKTGVEKAIETSETEAMAWMETALAEIN